MVDLNLLIDHKLNVSHFVISCDFWEKSRDGKSHVFLLKSVRLSMSSVSATEVNDVLDHLIDNNSEFFDNLIVKDITSSTNFSAHLLQPHPVEDLSRAVFGLHRGHENLVSPIFLLLVDLLHMHLLVLLVVLDLQLLLHLLLNHPHLLELLLLLLARRSLMLGR